MRGAYNPGRALVAFIDEVVNRRELRKGRYELAKADPPEPQYFFKVSELRSEFRPYWLSLRLLANQVEFGQAGLDLFMTSNGVEPTVCLMILIDEIHLRLINVPAEPACARMPVANRLQLKPAAALSTVPASQHVGLSLPVDTDELAALDDGKQQIERKPVALSATMQVIPRI